MTALTKQARETIKWWWFGETRSERTTIVGYTRHYFGDQGWHGDRCGCVDDRCIGYHHAGEDDCHCLPAWLDRYVAAMRQGGCVHPRLAEVGLTDECEYGCKIMRCACGKESVSHRAVYGCPIGS